MKFDVAEVIKGDANWCHIERNFPVISQWGEDSTDDGVDLYFIALEPNGSYLGGTVVNLSKLRYGPAGDVIAGYIEDIAVLEQFRHRGVGRALIRRALAEAWRHNAQHVRGTVSYDRTGTIAFYQKLGFALVPDSDGGVDAKQYIIVARESWAK